MAKSFMPNKIKNVVLLGHQASGKTSLIEAMMLANKSIAKKGSINEGTTTSDFTKEEKKAKTSIYTTVVSLNYEDYKINVLDTPGFLDYCGEVSYALRVASGAIIVVDATRGLEVGAKKAWKYVKNHQIPTIIFVNKMDKENANFAKTVEQLQGYIGKQVVAVQTPVGQESSFSGVKDVIEEKGSDEHYALVEAVSSHDDALMEKFLMEEEITTEEIKQGLASTVKEQKVIPVFAGSVEKDIAIAELLHGIDAYLPSSDNRGESDVKVDANGPLSALVFKTIVDPFVGKISYVHVISGSLKKDMSVYNSTKQLKDKIGATFMPHGKDQLDMESISAGDIGILTKVTTIETGDTICDEKNEVVFDKLSAPQPVVFFGVAIKNKNDEAKVAEALKKASMEDLSLSVDRNPETKQLVVGCQGQAHIDALLEKIRSNYNISCNTEEAKVSYRETIKGESDVEGKHKKQSGGAGQFGVVRIRFSPSDKDFEFVNDVFGGSVPTNYIPAVEKGLVESMKKGVLTGNPVVGVRAALYDGAYHPVDSNEISFKIAANLAFQEGCRKAKPVLLEPILAVTITVPNDYIGDVMSNVSKNRGTVGEMNSVEDEQVIHVEIPQVEFSKCVVELKTLTQAQASFTHEFLRYAEVPALMAEKVVASYKAANEQA